MTVTDDGDIVATGSSDSTLYSIKINSEGAVIWENTYPQSLVLEGRSIIEQENGSLVICGVSGDQTNICITKLESYGSLMWSQFTIVPGNGMDLAPIPGGYALTGFSTSIATPGSSDMLILEIIEDLTNIEL
jgi:hypothetical protein